MQKLGFCRFLWGVGRHRNDEGALRMRSIGRRKAMWWFHGDAKVDGSVVAEADVGAMLTD